jgi:uncharacterized membrane protein
MSLTRHRSCSTLAKEMNKQIQKNALILISAASIIDTLWLYSRAVYRIEGPNSLYPWLVSLEGTILFIAAAIPLLSAFRPSILNLRSVRWTGGLCITCGILMCINFFIRTPILFTTWYVIMGLRLVSRCALAYLTYWTLKNTTTEKLTSRVTQ